jgi:hypothetical protein
MIIKPHQGEWKEFHVICAISYVSDSNMQCIKAK